MVGIEIAAELSQLALDAPQLAAVERQLALDLGDLEAVLVAGLGQRGEALLLGVDHAAPVADLAADGAQERQQAFCVTAGEALLHGVLRALGGSADP